MSQDSVNATQDASAGVGARLRAAREASGLSRADIAARTKIAERHLIAIEESRFADLASRAYAVGFSRTYARAVGLDEKDVAATLREELGLADIQAEMLVPTAYEPVDPSRVPSNRTAWLAGLAAFILVIAGWLVWSRMMSPDLSAPPPPPATMAPATAAAEATGPVTLTALQDGVWLKVTDASGAQLFQKEMAKGESWTVPDEAATPSLRTAWPDALQISIGAEVLPPLSPTRQVISGVVLTAEALRARASGEAAPVSPPAVSVPASGAGGAATAAAVAPPPHAMRSPVPRPTLVQSPAPSALPAPAPAAPVVIETAAPAEASTETD